MASGHRSRDFCASAAAKRRRLEMAALLQVMNVSKNFSGLRAVADVSFKVPEGSIFAVIGPNGAGKTTLFNLIAGMFAPSTGTITFQDRRIDGETPDEVCRRGI